MRAGPFSWAGILAIGRTAVVQWTMLRRLARSLLLLTAPASLAAQSIRGTIVTRGDSVVVRGAIVLLLNGADSVVGRALSNERGEYRLAAPSAGAYRLRTLRIGFRPVLSDVMDVAAGTDIVRRLSFTDIPFQMDTVRVLGAMACRGRVDSAMSPLAVWEQARTALTAAQVSATDRALVSTIVRYDRVIDPVRDVVIKSDARIQTEFAPRPWTTLRPDSLRRVGYVVPDAQGDITYYAPDLDVLVSDDFVTDHCFRIVSSRDTSMLGLAFEPTRDRRNTAEIRGTLWLNRRTSELHDLEYRYVNIARTLADGRAGGTMGFARLPTGAWLISRWDIRMPVQESYVSGGFGGAARISDLRLAEIRLTGGDLALVRRGRDTLFSGVPVTLVGVVKDSASGKAIVDARVTLSDTAHATRTDADGRFRLPHVLPGNYAIAVHTPALDSLGTVVQVPVTVLDGATPAAIQLPAADQVATLLCGNRRVGLLTGTARLRGDSTAPGSMRVSVEWPDSTVTGQVHALEARADSAGRFRVCGVPIHTTFTVRLTGDSVVAEPLTRTIGSGTIARAELVAERHVNRGAQLVGVVLADSTRKPIAGVEVVLPTLGLATRTNERGEFRIADVPAGRHQVIARRFGYGPLEATVSVAGTETVDRKIFLTRIAILDTMSVTGSANRRGNGFGAFEERRRMGLGKFIDSTELRKNEHRRLGDLLASMAGVKMVSPPVCGANGLVSPHCVVSGTARVVFNNRAHCPMQVVVDGATVYRAKVDDAEWAYMFDVTRFASVQDLVGVEVYRTVAEVPPEFGGSASTCGLLMIWTRR